MRILRADLAQRQDAKAELGLFHFDARPGKLAHDFGHRHFGVGRGVAEQLAIAVFRILVVEEAMQERSVRRIDADFQRLQPVAIDHALERERVRAGRDKAIEMRKFRRRGGTHIGE